MGENSGSLGMNIVMATRMKYTPSLAGQATLLRRGFVFVATALRRKKRVDTNVGRKTAALLTHWMYKSENSLPLVLILPLVSSLYCKHESVHE